MKTFASSSSRRIVSLFIAGILTIIGGIFWLNNLAGAIRLHRALWKGVVPVGGGRGFLNFLQWSVVDVSTVTTFIFFFGFATAAVALWKDHRETSFFTRHDRFHIVLGLVGTLWGIILIGYYPIANVTIPSLMNCLHTAMFSTLAAIVWVMILEPLVILPWIRFALDRAEAPVPDVDPAQLLQEVTTTLQNFAVQLENGSKAAAGFEMQLAAWNDARQKEREENEKLRAESARALGLMTEIAASLEARQRAIAAENSNLRESVENKTQQLVDARAKIEALSRKLSAIREMLE